MRVASALALAGLALGGPVSAQAGATAVQHATGTFEVKITPEAQAPAPAGGLPTARMALAKTFAGAMQGDATGTMLSAGTPAPGQPAAYVAVDQFAGTLDGRRGAFLLLHRGTMTKAGRGDCRSSSRRTVGRARWKGSRAR